MNEQQNSDCEADAPVVLCSGDLFYTSDMAGYLRGLRFMALVAILVAPPWLLLFALLQG